MRRNKIIYDKNTPLELRHQRVLNLVRSYLQQNKLSYTESPCERTNTVYFYITAGPTQFCKIRVADHAARCTDKDWQEKGFVAEIRSDSETFPFNKGSINYVRDIIQKALRRSRSYANYKMFDKEY